MTICIATSNYLPEEGGITTFNRHLSDMLQQAGHKAIILTVGYNSKHDDHDEVTNEQNSLTIIRLKRTYHAFLKKYKGYFRPGGFDAPNWIAMGHAMREWLTKNKTKYSIDIIEASDYGGIGVFLTGNDLPPVVLTGHGSLHQLSKYNYVLNDDHAKVIRKLEYLSYQRTSGIITHSPAASQDVITIPGCIIFSAAIPFTKTEINYEPAVGNPFALSIGGLQKVKGTLVLADALKIVNRQSLSIKVKWAGSDTLAAGHRLSVARTLAIDYPEIWNNHFEWINGKTNEEVFQLIASCSFVIIPSLWETFNYAALEAASSAKAIIITDTTGAAHLFTHGHDAWIIPSDDSKKLADAIIYLQNNPGVCKKLGENARNMVANIFDKTNIIPERINIYKKVIETRKHYSDTVEKTVFFLKKYITPVRKLYFDARALAKKVIGKKNNG